MFCNKIYFFKYFFGNSSDANQKCFESKIETIWSSNTHSKDLLIRLVEPLICSNLLHFITVL